MNIKVNATALEIICEFESYTLARYEGNLGIWSIHQAIDWDATSKTTPSEPIIYFDHKEAYLMDDDCNHLLDPESYGLFECRVLDMVTEGKYLASLEKE